MKRGEIWWADLQNSAGKRPVILLSRDEAYKVRNLVTVAPVTTRIRNIPVEVRLTVADGLKKDSVINLDTITTIPKAWLIDRVCQLDQAKMIDLDNAIKFALGIDE